MKTKLLQEIHKQIPKKQEKYIKLQKEILISSLYVCQNRKYMYHMKDFNPLQKCKNKFDAFTSDGYRWI